MSGSTTDAVRMLLEARIRGGVPVVRSEGLSITQVQAIYESLAVTRGNAAKLAIVVDVWRAMDPVEISFFHKTMTGGDMRIGMSGPLLEQAIALAFEQPLDLLRYAAMIEGDAGRTAIRARNDELQQVEMERFRPLEFMLASAIEREVRPDGSIHFVPDPTIDITEYLSEDKLDGIRAQVHVGRKSPDDEDHTVMIFSRNQGELTATFPDVVSTLEHLPHGTVLDGELVAIDPNGEIAHFNNLQQRLGVKKPTAAQLSKYPVLFVAYDLLIDRGESLLEMPIAERRIRLESLAREYSLPLTGQRPIAGWDDLEIQFAAARARGNEGLMLKRRGSRYEYGKRGKTWLKAKKEGGSIDAVIRYAAGGSGRRSGVLSDFTFGVWLSTEEGRRLVNIGKAYGGYTNEELAELNRQLKQLRGERFGNTYEIEPRIVCELVYDFIQPNPRSEAGYTLRFPRIRRIRWDLGLDDVDSVEDVARLYQEDLGRSTGSAGAIFIPPSDEMESGV
jgi:DNA ligase-1